MHCVGMQNDIACLFNWASVSRFNFSYAIPGGAWVEDAAGNKNWFSFEILAKAFGEDWIMRQIKRQGWMTGCWVSVA